MSVARMMPAISASSTGYPQVHPHPRHALGRIQLLSPLPSPPGLPMDSVDHHPETKKIQETPLPWRQLGILLLLNLAEPMSASIIYPFIAQLIEELGVAQEKSSIGYYVGMMQSLFFLTEAVFILQWGRLSDRIGRKPVLVTGLLGLVLSMLSFGLSHSFVGIVISRALAGALNGNIGVIKTAIGEISDDSNIARAFSYLPLVWFVGSTVAPLIGGFLSHPAQAFPSLFQHRFWKESPYFLPCATAATFSLSCCITAIVFLKETNPNLRRSQHQTSSHSAESGITSFPIGEGNVEAVLLGPKTPSPPKEVPPIRSLLTKPVRLAVLNYGLLALLEISFIVIRPVFLASTLGFSPSSIGMFLGTMGLVNGTIQIAFFVPIRRRTGSRTLFTLGICSFGIIFSTYPLITRLYLANGNLLGFTACALLALQMALVPIEQMAFNVITLYIQASPGSKSVLGATNGIAQMAASVARAIGPASATSLFAVSMRMSGTAGGDLVYYVLGFVTVLAILVSRMLPAEPWSRSVESEYTS